MFNYVFFLDNERIRENKQTLPEPKLDPVDPEESCVSPKGEEMQTEMSSYSLN